MTQDRKGIMKQRAAHRARGGLSHQGRIAPSSIILLILTPICVAASILLPNFVSAYNNEHILNTSQYYPIPIKEIATAAEASAQASDLRGADAVMRALQVLSGNCYLVSSSDGFRMKRDQVLDEVTNALTLFSENGFGVKSDLVKLHDVTQELVISSDGGTMIRVWSCSLRFTDKSKGDLILRIDDASGKIVFYELDSYIASNLINLNQSKDADVIETWAKMWNDYLGIEFDSDAIADVIGHIGEDRYHDSEESSVDDKAIIELSASLLIRNSKIFLNIFWVEEEAPDENEMRLILNMSPQMESADGSVYYEGDGATISSINDNNVEDGASESSTETTS